jgi:hypothetical protein
MRALMIGVPVLWMGEAFAVSWAMSRRGFHPLSWCAVGFLLGPAVWPLALMEAVSGRPHPNWSDVATLALTALTTNSRASEPDMHRSEHRKGHR